MTWKEDIIRSGEHGGYLVDSGFVAQCMMACDQLIKES